MVEGMGVQLGSVGVGDDQLDVSVEKRMDVVVS